MTIEKAVAFVAVTEEMLADGRSFLDHWRTVDAAREAARGERYNGVYQRGYQTGAYAAFDALREFIDKGGRIGLPLGPDSLHAVTAGGMSVEILSLLALRPWVP